MHFCRLPSAHLRLVNLVQADAIRRHPPRTPLAAASLLRGLTSPPVSLRRGRGFSSSRPLFATASLRRGDSSSRLLFVVASLHRLFAAVSLSSPRAWRCDRRRRQHLGVLLSD